MTTADNPMSTSEGQSGELRSLIRWFRQMYRLHGDAEYKEAADTIHALQAQVEVLRKALTMAVSELELDARGLVESSCLYLNGAYDRSTADPDDMREIERVEAIAAAARAALSPIKASDADRREVKT